jgi:hypothetical protein
MIFSITRYASMFVLSGGLPASFVDGRSTKQSSEKLANVQKTTSRI